MSDDEDPKFPRLIAGEWEKVSFDHEDIFDLIRTGSADYFGNRRVTLESNKLNLWDGKKLVQSIKIEMPPKSPYSENAYCDQLVRFSADGNLIWYLGYQSQKATCFLLDRTKLEILDQFQPKIFEWSTESFHDSEDWWELDARVLASHPSAILIHANAGDDIALLYGLVSSGGSIQNLAGEKLYETAASILDERIGDAVFAKPHQVLILDDIGCISSCSYPAPEIQHQEWLRPMLEDDDYNIQIWGEDEDGEDFEVSCDLGWAEDRILVNVVQQHYGEKNWIELIATLVLKIDLSPVGFMRPPTANCDEIFQFRNELFANLHGFWKPVFYETLKPFDY